MTAPIPAAEIIAERNYGGIVTVRVFCPGCQRTHIHRAPATPGTVVTVWWIRQIIKCGRETKIFESTSRGSCGARYTIGGGT